MKFKFDSDGLIVQTDGDGGDSAARTGLYYFLQAIRGNEMSWDFAKAISALQVRPGVFVRSKQIAYNEPSDFSRDQENPIVMALGFYKNTHMILKMMLWNRLKRFGFYQNKDFSSPEHFGMILRSLRWWIAYPFLFLGDLFMLINSIVRICSGVDLDDVGDDVNHSMSLIQAHYIYPTPLSIFATFLYAKYRPHGVQYAWDHYFRPDTNANPFNDLARPIISDVLT